MTTAQHTPGPWIIIEDCPDACIGYRAIVALDDDQPGETICNPSPMGAANARLIAAAPELLAALKRARYHLEGQEYLDGLQVIRAAIARAIGEDR